MASISLQMDTRTVKNGMSPVRIRISHRSTNAFINTKVMAEPACFCADNFREPLSRSAYMYRQKNEQIASIIRKYDEVLFDIERDDSISLDTMTANDIRTYIIGERTCTRKRVTVAKRKRGGDGDFSAWMYEVAATKKPRRKKDMEDACRVIERYCKDCGRDRLWFDELNYELMVDIEQWIASQGLKDATRYKVFSTIKHAWNEADKLEMVNGLVSPFKRYKIRPVPIKDEIEVISLEGMRRLVALQLEDGSQLARARDMMVLSFLICGPNLMDLYHFTDVVRGDELVYVRHKSQDTNSRPIHIHMEPEIQMMIDMYRGTDHLLYLQDRYANYSTFQRNNNRACAQLSKMVGEKVNMELLRHTWASIAGELDVPNDIIDHGLGHAPTTTTNKYYKKTSRERMRIHNRRVMDYVLYGAE